MENKTVCIRTVIGNKYENPQLLDDVLPRE